MATTLDGTAVGVTWLEPTAIDDSGTAIDVTSTSVSGDAFSVGATPVVYTFTDDSGNAAVCDFVVTVTGLSNFLTFLLSVLLISNNYMNKDNKNDNIYLLIILLLTFFMLYLYKV